MEPPGTDLPARAGSLAALGPLRLSAAAAAAVLALSSTGHIVVLVAAVAVAVARPMAVGAVALAAFATVERWGTTSLDAVAGAQSVLGPGGLVGPTAAAASAWCAAAAFVLASSWVDGDGEDPARGRVRPAAVVLALATGPAAAVVVAGPHFAADLPVRLGATVAAVVVAAVAGSCRWHHLTTGLALGAGVIAAALASVAAAARVGL